MLQVCQSDNETLWVPLEAEATSKQNDSIWKGAQMLKVYRANYDI